MRRNENRSKKFFARAQKYFVGGVNSPVRSFKGVERDYPLFISSAKGSRIRDEDGNEYIDYVCSWGASILGSGYPSVTKAVEVTADKGLSFGAATNRESDLGERIQKSFPSIELMRLVSSGTEATMSAIRLARAFTKKEKIIKFDGCYHGHADSFLVHAGSGLATFSMPDSAGVPDPVASDTLVARYNDPESANKLVSQNKFHVACIIVEPVAGNMGVIPPEPGFLEGLRKLCDDNEILLIFDEVITGFRVARGGAQELYKVTPDLTCLGKIIGGGMNIAAYGGRKDIMQLVSPLGPVYQAGTLAGNPVSVAAGIATLDALTKSVYSKLEVNSSRLAEGIADGAEQNGIALTVQRIGSMLGVFFYSNEKYKGTTIKNNDDIKNKCARKPYSEFFKKMLEEGIYLPPSPYETIFASASHSKDDISKTIRATESSFEQIANSRVAETTG